MESRHLFARLATLDVDLVEAHNNSKLKDEPKTKYNTCSVTFQIYMKSAFYAMNNGFTQLDAYRSFCYGARAQLKKQKRTLDDDVEPEDISSCRLIPQFFNVTLRHATSLYNASMEGLELLDLDALPLSNQDEADKFAATFAACLPEPIMFPVVLEEKEESKTTKESKSNKKNKKKGEEETVKIKKKEDINATINQYINDAQNRLLSFDVLSEILPYHKGIQQLFISYMTDDLLTGEPPSWNQICLNQLQLKPFDVDSCLCALRIVPDLVPHREFQALIMALSPVSGCILFPQFIELLWRCSTISPLAKISNSTKNNNDNMTDSEIIASLFSHAGMRPDIPTYGASPSRRREDAMYTNEFNIPTSRLSPRSGFESKIIKGKNEDDFNGRVIASGSGMYEEKYENNEITQQEEKGIRLLLDQLELNLSNQEENMRKVPAFGFPSSNELSKRDIELNSQPNVWHPMPCVLREVCRAPDAPLIIENLMEAALAYHNSSQYDLAINAYISARSNWIDIIAQEQQNISSSKGDDEEDEDLTEEEMEEKKLKKLEALDIPPRASIFILCGIGSVS
jgi:hypothetical protein